MPVRWILGPLFGMSNGIALDIATLFCTISIVVVWGGE